MHSREALARKTAGFGLIELLITVAILAILVAVAFPSFEGSMRNNRVTSATNEMIASLSLARMEALRNPRGAVLCASGDGINCGSNWNDGWMVFIDVDGDGDPGGTDDRILRYVQGKSRMSVASTSGGGVAFANKIIFDNRGRVDEHSRTLTLQPDTCPTGQQLRRTIDVGLTGQARTTRVACT